MKSEIPMAKVVVYGADWCPDCVRSKRFLSEHGVDFDWHDIQANPELADKVVEYNIQAGYGPKRRIPVILVGERILSEPSNDELSAALAGESLDSSH
jgi:thioredoxin reductase (NADPH)